MNNLTITDVRCEMGDSAFLIDDGKTSVLYDTGFGFTGFSVADNIKKALGKRKLDYIFLTHSHYDHALGSAYILRRFPNAKVVAGKYAAEVFKRDGAKRTMKELDLAFAKKCNAKDYEFLADELRVDILVCEGDVIKAGEMNFEVIALPGHTKCSIGFYEREKELFLSSETLGVYDGETLIVPSFLVSYKDTINSIDKVKNLKIKHILSPHYGILDKTQTSYFLENMKASSEDGAKEILSHIKNGKSDEEIVEIIKKRYWKGYIRKIYPEDAVTLNTSIMIELVRKELG